MVVGVYASKKLLMAPLLQLSTQVTIWSFFSSLWWVNVGGGVSGVSGVSGVLATEMRHSLGVD